MELKSPNPQEILCWEEGADEDVIRYYHSAYIRGQQVAPIVFIDVRNFCSGRKDGIDGIGKSACEFISMAAKAAAKGRAFFASIYGRYFPEVRGLAEVKQGILEDIFLSRRRKILGCLFDSINDGANYVILDGNHRANACMLSGGIPIGRVIRDEDDYAEALTLRNNRGKPMFRQEYSAISLISSNIDRLALGTNSIVTLDSRVEKIRSNLRI